MLNRIWRAIWFKDDDDNTPQGKLARGCFYLVYWIIAFAILSSMVHFLFDK